MRTIKLIIIFTIIFTRPGILILNSQNLVPNSSFEEKIDFNQGNPVNWIKCLKNDTPDHFLFESEDEFISMKSEYYGGTAAYDGNGFVGIFCYRVNPYRGIADIREFIQIGLISPLKKDSLYKVSLFIKIDQESNRAINYFHIHFSDIPIKKTHEKQIYGTKPSITFRKNYFDNVEWVELEETYRALGNEKFIILGNFYPDRRVRTKKVGFEKENNLKLKWNLGEKETVAYYYIDKIMVSPIHEMREKNQQVPSTIQKDTLNKEINETIAQVDLDIEKIEIDSSVVLKNIHFEFDKTVLLPESFKELDRLYCFLRDNKDIHILIEGHTDNIGTDEYNQELSLRRAKVVAEYLIDKGINQERLTWKGYGKTRPISYNQTEEGRKINRRVAFRIIKN
jgi:outer membrane protein OmpA-like peptidoglycan-associated protein